MSKDTPIKVLFFISLCFFLFVFLGGCQSNEAANEEDLFEIIIFSSLPESSLEKVKGVTNDYFLDETQYKIHLFPPVVERLIIEVVRHAGDIFIIDRDLLLSIYDTEELHSLDALRNEKNSIELNEYEREAMLANGQMTEEDEFDTFQNALRVINTSLFFPEMADSEELIDLELVAVIPKYAEQRETAFEVLKELVQ